MFLQYPLRSSWWVRVVSSECAKFFAPSMPPADYEGGVYFRYSRQAHWSAQHHLGTGPSLTCRSHRRHLT